MNQLHALKFAGGMLAAAVALSTPALAQNKANQPPQPAPKQGAEPVKSEPKPAMPPETTKADRPVETQLKAFADGIALKAPDAAKKFEDGIKALEATGIVDKAPKVGDKAPAFELPDSTGKNVRLADLLKKGPVIVTWYRGGWCPYCNIALKGLADVEPAIREQGATLVAITPETPDYSAETVKADGLNFAVLSDKGNAVARAYKVVFKLSDSTSATMKAFKIELAKRNGDASDELPLAVTYIIDKDSTIRWAYVNADYRKRAEPSDVVEALKSVKK